MGCAEAVIDIQASPKDVLEFVMDLRRYRQADHKVGPVLWLRRARCERPLEPSECLLA